MKPRTLAILAVATIVFVVAAIVVGSRTPAYTGSTGGQLVFPDLAARINDAAKLIVQTADHSFTVVRTDKGWALADKHGYPAKFDQVKGTLVALAQLKTAEAKTAEPSLYPRLEVEDMSQKGAKGELLTVEDGKGDKLASLILGKRHYGRGAEQAIELYVRKAGEAQSWLASGTLERADDVKAWLVRDVVSLERDRVREVTVTPAGDKAFTLSKAKAGEGDFTLAELPDDSKLKSPYDLNALAGVLGLLLLDDVLPAAELKADAKPVTTLEYKSFDGLVVELALVEQDGKAWAKIKAAYSPEGTPPAAAEPAKGEPAKGEAEKAAAKTAETPAPAADKAKPKSADEVKNEAAAINERGKDWLFGLAANDLATLEKKLPDLIEPKDKTKPKS
ncbi:MAG: DUF4340 domain-containing protein [Alphaproteobacteria bacterium]